MTDLRYTLVQPPSSVWECGDCGALVIRCSVHDGFHTRLQALQDRLARQEAWFTPKAGPTASVPLDADGRTPWGDKVYEAFRNPTGTKHVKNDRAEEL